MSNVRTVDNVTKESVIRVANDYIIYRRDVAAKKGKPIEGNNFGTKSMGGRILSELAAQLQVWENGGAEDELPKWQIKAATISLIVLASTSLATLLVVAMTLWPLHSYFAAEAMKKQASPAPAVAPVNPTNTPIPNPTQPTFPNPTYQYPSSYPGLQ